MKTLKSKIIALAVCSALTASAFAAITNSSDDATKATLSVSITAIKPHEDKGGASGNTGSPGVVTTKQINETTLEYSMKAKKWFAFYAKWDSCKTQSGKNDRCQGGWTNQTAAQCDRYKNTTYLVTYNDGKETSRQAINATYSWKVNGIYETAYKGYHSRRLSGLTQKTGGDYTSCAKMAPRR